MLFFLRSLHCNLSESLIYASILPRISRITRMKAVLSESISHPCHPCHPWFNFFGCGLPRWVLLRPIHFLWLRLCRAATIYG